MLSQIYKPENNLITDQLMKDAQKCRDQVTQCLIQDGWQNEAIHMLEENREFQKTLQEEQEKPIQFFKYEM